MHDDEIIGEGYHKKFGGPHAEIEALRSVPSNKKNLLKDSLMYVSLEPCRIFGKTPPCSEAILDAGIRKLFVSCQDPNPEMKGKSLAWLKAQGVEVVSGILEKDGLELIRPFIANLDNRPFIQIKFAQSSDNYIGKLDRRVMISNPVTNRNTHKWRAQCDGILIGYNTALLDNPQLTTRYWPGDTALRIIVDKELSLPKTHHLWQDEYETLFISKKRMQSDNPRKRVAYCVFDENWQSKLCHMLYKEEGICRLLIEGGSKTIKGFTDRGLWDEIWQIKSRTNLKSGVPAPFINVPPVYLERFLDDELYCYHNNDMI